MLLSNKDSFAADLEKYQHQHERVVRFTYDKDSNPIPDGTFWVNGYYYKGEKNEEYARKYTARRGRSKNG